MRRPLLIVSLILVSVSGAWALDSLRRIDDTRLLGTVTAVDMRKGVTMRVATSVGVRTVTVPFDEVLILRFGGVSKKTFTGDDRIVLASGECYRVRVLGSEADPLIKTSTNLRLIGLTVVATAVTGVISEILHWTLVRLRRMRGDEEPKVQVKAAVAKAGGPMS